MKPSYKVFTKPETEFNFAGFIIFLNSWSPVKIPRFRISGMVMPVILFSLVSW